MSAVSVGLTGFERLDPLIALMDAANILITGIRLLRRSAKGLLDVAIPPAELETVKSILGSYESRGVKYHALRTRQAARRNYLAVHLLAPGDWTITQGHQVAEMIEQQVREAGPNTNIVTHVEPLEDPRAWRDVGLDIPEQKLD